MSIIAIKIYLIHDYLIMPYQASPRGCLIGVDAWFCRRWAGVGLDMPGNLPAAMVWPGRAGSDIASLTKAATHASAKFGNRK